MTLQVYNSLSKEKEAFEPVRDDGTVRMYVCGQTVYDYMHIGHARTYVAFDIIRRYLAFKGYAVKTVINITDVNDKINDRAEEEGRSPWDVAEEYGRINLEDFQALGVSADAYPKASEYVPEMIQLVEELEENGYAYEVDGDVFFAVHQFAEYGQLSHQDLEDIRPEREDDIVASDKKQHPEDFVLWKSRESDEYQPTWDSPWGEGVPGWHIECSAMARTLLGDRFDIHGGGADLVFPHHEDEIAQAEGATGVTPWVQYWMHSGLVRMDEDKMSKSLGNFVPSRELLDEYGARTIRYLVAGTHYRKPLDYSEEKLAEAAQTVEQLQHTVDTLDAELRDAALVPDKYTDRDRAALATVLEEREAFITAMDDDFNTPEALKHLHAIRQAANSYVQEAETPKRPVLERLRDTLQELGGILGVLDETEQADDTAASVIDTLLEQREKHREDGHYDVADMLREAVEDAGITVEDTDDGPRWTR